MSDGAVDPSATTSVATQRLRKRRDFLAAASGRRFHTERMTAQGRVREPHEIRDGRPAEGLHVGFTVTKRVGHATERNRIRRRLRRAVALAAEAGPRCAADIVVIARRPALDAPFATLVEDLRRAFATVTKPRDARSASGGRHRKGAHDGSARPAPRPPQPMTPHGSTDG